MKKTDPTITKPKLNLITDLLIAVVGGNAEGRIATAGTEDIGVEYTIDEVGYIVVAAADESDDDNAGGELRRRGLRRG